MKITIKHHQAVWETTTIDVEVPDLESAVENADELIAEAIENDRADIACGDHVESMDSDIEILDEQGNYLYRSVEPDEHKLIPPRPIGTGPVPDLILCDGCEAENYPERGIIWHPGQADVDDEPDIQQVQRCDTCQLYLSDEAAARVIAAEYDLEAVFLEDREWDIDEADRGKGLGCYGVRKRPVEKDCEVLQRPPLMQEPAENSDSDESTERRC